MVAFFCASAAGQGDEPAATVTGRGIANASSCIGAGNGAAPGQAGELSVCAINVTTPPDDLFNTSPFDFRRGAGHDLAESGEAGEASPVFVRRKN
jgi:hypothetical protein